MNARTRVFGTPWNDCRACGASGQIGRVTRLRMRHNQGILRHLQAVEVGTCPRCDGRGRRFVGLFGALIELAFAAWRPWKITIRAFLSPTKPRDGVIRSLDDATPPTRWRRTRAAWRYSRAQARAQIRAIAADFRAAHGG